MLFYLTCHVLANINKTCVTDTHCSGYYTIEVNGPLFISQVLVIPKKMVAVIYFSLLIYHHSIIQNSL